MLDRFRSTRATDHDASGFCLLMPKARQFEVVFVPILAVAALEGATGECNTQVA